MGRSCYVSSVQKQPKCNQIGSQTLSHSLVSSPETEDQVKGGLLLDVVVGESPAVLKLLASEDQPLLVRGDPLLVLDLGLHILDGVARLHLQGNGLTREGLDEDLHFDPH